MSRPMPALRETAAGDAMEGNRLSAVLRVDAVALDVAAADEKALFDEAARLFVAIDRTVDAHAVAQSLLARERLGSTALGHGVAIPHCRLKRLRQPVAAVMRSREPIAFGAPDNEPVRLFVFLFVPESATQSHLEILAEIAEMLGDGALRERLLGAPDRVRLDAEIRRWQPRCGA